MVRLIKEHLNFKEAVASLNKMWGNDRSLASCDSIIRRNLDTGYGIIINEVRAQLQEGLTSGDVEAGRILDLERREEKTANREREIDKKIKELLDAQDAERKFLETTETIIKGFGLKPLVSPPKPTKSDKRTAESAVLLLSDLHAGEIVDPRDMGGLGEFNWSILEARLSYVIENSLLKTWRTITSRRFISRC